jgi:hypothetical protein
MDHCGKCPECGSNWDAGPIPEEHKGFYSPPYRFSRLVGLEFPDKYDGVWEWACPDCDARFPRLGELNGKGRVQNL